MGAMAKVLTARAVEIAKPKRNSAGKLERNETPDGGFCGLYLTVEVTGTKSWYLRHRHNGKPARKRLGAAGAGGLSPAAARHEAAAEKQRLEAGEDRAPRLPIQEVQAGGDAIETVVASFLELHAYRKTRFNTALNYERLLNSAVIPAWRGRSVESIRRRDVIGLVEQIAIDRPYLANRTRDVLSKLFNWLVSRDVLDVSPVVGVGRPHPEVRRTRALTDDELRRLWIACEDFGTFGQALRLLILVGGRRNEASRMRWSELDGRTWVLPPERVKNRTGHAVALSEQDWAIVQAQPRFAGCDYVFTVDGQRPISGWDNAKKRISQKAAIAETSWRLHDLRRTVASGMQKLGIATPVVERALGHSSGTFVG